MFAMFEAFPLFAMFAMFSRTRDALLETKRQDFLIPDSIFQIPDHRIWNLEFGILESRDSKLPGVSSVSTLSGISFLSFVSAVSETRGLLLEMKQDGPAKAAVGRSGFGHRLSGKIGLFGMLRSRGDFCRAKDVGGSGFSKMCLRRREKYVRRFQTTFREDDW
ncbi:MAG: hypothetical protein IPM21_18045 [Acidobacteria bacterium]|nr:hypothetical protein [Acidobacteriota bacterium]